MLHRILQDRWVVFQPTSIYDFYYLYIIENMWICNKRRLEYPIIDDWNIIDKN